MDKQSMRSMKSSNFNSVFYRLFNEQPTALFSAPPHKIRKLLNTLNLHLMRERNKGLSKHYTYDFNHHIALASAKQKLLEKLNLQNDTEE